MRGDFRITRYRVLTPPQPHQDAQQPTETACPLCGQVAVTCPGCGHIVLSEMRRSYCSNTCRERLKKRRQRKRQREGKP